ncbi:MAG: hypothetical protein ACM3XO_26265 [Bacteroidota bacterium]
MNISDDRQASEKLHELKSMFRVEIQKDWGDGSGSWEAGAWSQEDLDRLHNTLICFADCMGGMQKVGECTGGVTAHREDLGSHGGEALAHRVSFSIKQPFSAWTVVHEFAHAWDANYGWKLSRMLEKYTGGYTNPVFSLAKRLAGQSDSGLFDQEDQPGRRGRKPGCNQAGYFYGDKPSGSNWNFNRVEDFAEAVAMYVGWERGNDLSSWARARLDRYLLADGESSKYFGIDNWSYYKQYFYPENGDYSKTRRWRFVDDLVKGRIAIQ